MNESDQRWLEEMVQTAQTIRQRVENVFSREEAAVPANVIDPRDRGHWERDEIQHVFQGRPWRDLTNEELHKWACALCYLTAEAMHYYLPAFLLAAIDVWQSSSALPDYVVLNLAPTPHNGWMLNQLAGRLSLSQCEVVEAFLEWFQASRQGCDQYVGEARKFWRAVSEGKQTNGQNPGPREEPSP